VEERTDQTLRGRRVAGQRRNRHALTEVSTQIHCLWERRNSHMPIEQRKRLLKQREDRCILEGGEEPLQHEKRGGTDTSSGERKGGFTFRGTEAGVSA
jgi:hypothetical protein